MTIDEVRKGIEATLAKLKQDRDELRVKLSLAKLEASDDWKVIESKLAKLEARAKELRGATAESAKHVGAAARLLAEEVRNAIRNVAQHV